MRQPCGSRGQKGVRHLSRLVEIRKELNVRLAHLTTHRVLPRYKRRPITTADIEQIREHTRRLFAAFHRALDDDHRAALVNPLARKFAAYEILNPPEKAGRKP
jgi:transposase